MPIDKKRTTLMESVVFPTHHNPTHHNNKIILLFIHMCTLQGIYNYIKNRKTIKITISNINRNKYRSPKLLRSSSRFLSLKFLAPIQFHSSVTMVQNKIVQSQNCLKLKCTRKKKQHDKDPNRTVDSMKSVSKLNPTSPQRFNNMNKPKFWTKLQELTKRIIYDNCLRSQTENIQNSNEREQNRG